MIADTLSYKKFNPILTVLLIRGRKLNISLVFITQSYLAVPKNIRINSTHYFQVLKVRNKQEFLVIDATLASDNPLSLRMNLLEII